MLTSKRTSRELSSPRFVQGYLEREVEALDAEISEAIYEKDLNIKKEEYAEIYKFVCDFYPKWIESVSAIMKRVYYPGLNIAH